MSFHRVSVFCSIMPKEVHERIRTERTYSRGPSSPYCEYLDSIDHDLHERLMHAVEEGDIEIIDMWEEGDGDQDVTFVKRKLEKVLRELMADPRLAGHQHYGFKLQANPRGERIYACEANGSVAFQLAQLSMGPDTVPMALVAYIDGTFMKRGIGIRPIYCEYIRYHI